MSPHTPTPGRCLAVRPGASKRSHPLAGLACAFSLLVLATCDKGGPTETPQPQPKPGPEAPSVAQVLVRPATVTLEAGDTAWLSAIVMDSAGNAMEEHAAVQWMTSTPEVARVEADGRLVGIGDGEATVRAVVDGITGESGVRVLADSIVAVAIAAPPPLLLAGDSLRLTAGATAASGRVIYDLRLEWRSLHPAVATVTAEGAVRAAGPGVAQVVAGYGAAADTVALVVTSAATVAVRVAETELGGPGLSVESPLSDRAFVVNGVAPVGLSSVTSQLLMVMDATPSLRGLAVTDPRSMATRTPLVDAASTAAAVIFMTPGVLTNAPELAAARLDSIAALACYPGFVSHLRTQLRTQALAAVMQGATAVQHLETCLNQLDAARALSAANASSLSFQVQRTFPQRRSVSDLLVNAGMRRVDVWEERVSPYGNTYERRLASMAGTETGYISFSRRTDTPKRVTLTSALPSGSVTGVRLWVVGPGSLTSNGPRLPQHIQERMPSALVRLYLQTYWDYVALELIGMLPVDAEDLERVRDVVFSSDAIIDLTERLVEAAAERRMVDAGLLAADLAKEIFDVALAVLKVKLDWKELTDILANGVQLGRFIINLMLREQEVMLFELPPSFGRVQQRYGDGQTGAAGAALGSPVGVRVVGVTGTGLSGVRVTFTTDDGGSFSPASVLTNANGEATVQWRLGSRGGEQQAFVSVTAEGSTSAHATGSPLTLPATATGGSSSLPAARMTVSGNGVTVQEGGRGEVPLGGAATVELSLDASRSSGGSSGIKAHSWKVNNAVVSSAQKGTARLGAGTHTISLTVTSNDNKAHTATATVVVKTGTASAVCTSGTPVVFLDESYKDNTPVPAGQAFTKTWTLRNGGDNCVWNSGITLRYVSNAGTMLSTSQAQVAVSGIIQPNGSYTFSVPMRAPTAPGTYREDWRLVDPNGNTLRVGTSPTVWAQIVVPQPQTGPVVCTAATGAAFVGESHPDGTPVNPGQTFTKTWTLRNPGASCVWNAGITLRYVTNSAGLLSTSQSAIAVAGTVQPSGSYTFSVPMRAPTAPGSYREDWRLVDAEGNTIRVGNSSTVWALVVVGNPPVLKIDGGTSSTKQIGQTFTVTGSGFTPGRSVTRRLRQPNGTEITLAPAMSADGSGNLSWTFTPVCTTPTGTSTLWIIDDATGRTSNTVTQVVTASASCNPPVLRIDGGTSSTKPIGGTFTVTGSGFTPGRSVTRRLRQPNGTEITLAPAMSADGSGNLSWNFTPVCTTPTGTSTLWIIDDATGRTSNTVTQVVTASASCNPPVMRIDGGTSSTKQIGQTFTVTGSGFTPGRSVTRRLRQPNGTEITLAPAMSADASGNLSWTFTPVCTTPTGTSTLWIIDDATGRTSNTVTQVVTASASCNPPVMRIDGGTSSTKQIGQTFTVTGSGFTPGRSVTRRLRQPNGTEITLAPAMSADASGNLSWTFTPVCTTPTGTSTLWIIDDATGRTSNTVTQVVTANPSCNPPVMRIDGGTSSTKQIGQTFTVTGSGFTPGRSVTRRLRQPNGTEITLAPAMSADGAGNLSWTFTPVCTTPTGTSTLWIIDDATGRTSNTVTQVVTANPSCNPPVMRIDGGTSSTKQIGQTFTVTGSGFTPGRSVTRRLRQPNGTEITLAPAVSADGSGNLSWNFTPVCTTPTGTSTLWIIDDATGRTSNNVTQTVTSSTACIR